MNEFYEENGYLLVRGLFDAGDVDEMKDALARILAAEAGDANHSWSAVADRQLVLKGHHDLQYHDAVFTRMVAHPRLVAVLTELIGPNVQLHHSKMLVKPPSRARRSRCTRTTRTSRTSGTACSRRACISTTRTRRTAACT